MKYSQSSLQKLSAPAEMQPVRFYILSSTKILTTNCQIIITDNYNLIFELPYIFKSVAENKKFNFF